MTFKQFGKFATIAVAIALAACSRNQEAQNEPAQPPVSEAAAALSVQVQAEPAPPPAIPAATELRVTSINSVMLSRPEDAPGALVIHVAGMAASNGWTDPKLAEMSDDAGDGTTRTFQFMATSPQNMEERRVTQPIEAEIRVDTLPTTVRKVRIVSGTNEVSAPVVQ